MSFNNKKYGEVAKKVILASKKLLLYLLVGLTINLVIILIIELGKLIAPFFKWGYHKIIELIVNTFKCGPLEANFYILMGLIISVCVGYVFVRLVENFELADNQNNGID